MKKLMSVIAASILLTGAAKAETMVIDFEGFQTGEIIAGQFNPFVSLSTSSRTNTAIIFDSENPTGGDADLEIFTSIPNGFDEHSAAGNLLIIAEDVVDYDRDGLIDDPDDDAAGGTFLFEFNEAVNFLGLNGVDFSDGGSAIIIELIGAGSETLFSFNSITDLALDGTLVFAGDNVSFALFENVFGDGGVSGVLSASITLTGSGAIDNLKFLVPIPGALPLMLTALGFGGFISRRRKLKAA